MEIYATAAGPVRPPLVESNRVINTHNFYYTGWPDWISWLWSISGSHIYLTNIWKIISFMLHLTGGSSSKFCQLMQISRTSSHEIQWLIEHSCFSLDGASTCYVLCNLINSTTYSSDSTLLKLFFEKLWTSPFILSIGQVIEHITLDNQQWNQTLLNNLIASWPFGKV